MHASRICALLCDVTEDITSHWLLNQDRGHRVYSQMIYCFIVIDLIDDLFLYSYLYMITPTLSAGLAAQAGRIQHGLQAAVLCAQGQSALLSQTTQR